MSPDTRLMCGLTLILIPTIVYGGLTLLGILSGGALGVPGPKNLSSEQQGLYRAGHAHAGVLSILCLILQIGLDSAQLTQGLIWFTRVAALTAALFVSGGFFATAHFRRLRFLLYLGATLVATVTLIVGIGLLRSN